MKPDEYRTALAALGMTINEIGELFRVNYRTAQRWASGDQDIPRPVEMLLFLMLERDISGDEMAAKFPPDRDGPSRPWPSPIDKL